MARAHEDLAIQNIHGGVGDLKRSIVIVGALLVACAKPAAQQPGESAAIADPAAEAAHPAGIEAFVLPSHGSGMNAVMYMASGAGPHPTLLLLHGFPGNEQNLDLAQAARRAGWNVLTFHYRGAWGSKGSFSFLGAAEDAHTALAFLEDPANAAHYRINTKRIAVAGHSMGGFLAADAAADNPRVRGLFLIDPWNLGADGRKLGTPEASKAWHTEVVGDLPPLSGTDEPKLTAELKANASRLDLTARTKAFGHRPVDIIGAERGVGQAEATLLSAVQAAGNDKATGAVWPTDHSFSDHRIALSKRLVSWLGKLAH
jgi:pimeloyl-ACP methyl ester carboxylesterase